MIKQAAQFLDRKTIAELTAKMYLDTGAVRFMAKQAVSSLHLRLGQPGLWRHALADLLSRNTLDHHPVTFAVATIERDIGRDKIDAVAGGETAGIPFAAWVADRLNLPMQYVRKKPKGFGRNAQIEGRLKGQPARAAGRIWRPTAAAR